MLSEVDALRKERSWLGPLVIGLLVQLIVGGALWFSELRSHGQDIERLTRQYAALESRVTALEQDGATPAMAKDIAVIKERVDWIGKAVEGLQETRKRGR